MLGSTGLVGLPRVCWLDGRALDGCCHALGSTGRDREGSLRSALGCGFDGCCHSAGIPDSVGVIVTSGRAGRRLFDCRVRFGMKSPR